MEKSSEILSGIVQWMKYSKYDDNKKRRELFYEAVNRNRAMHLKKFKHIPGFEEELINAYMTVYDKKVLGSMRAMQFSGRPIEINPARQYNCSYLAMDDWRAFSEIMFLLLGGTGVGFSVQNHHIEKLPEIKKPIKRKRRYLIGDSIEGWADAVKTLMKSYFSGTSTIVFDYSDIRAKGERLITSGGKAPGPQPLHDCLHNIRKVLEAKETGEKLTSLEVHDIVCYIADAVLAGGIRRAALISLFDFDDEQMISCKAGNWWEYAPQRARSNNSAVVLRHKIKKEEFLKFWEKIEASNSGEPGIYFSNNADRGVNPCCLSGDTVIQTKDGDMTIEEIVAKVNQGEEISVLSYDEFTKTAEYQEVLKGQLMREDADVIRIETEDGQELVLTPDHKVYTENRGYVEAAQLTPEDVLVLSK